MSSSKKAAFPLAVLASLAAAGPAVAAAPSPSAQAAGSGGSAVLTYPASVRTRVGRTERALERAVDNVQAGEQADAATSLKVVRRQMAAAWRGARYIISTAPPPPPPGDAHSSQAQTYAAPADTGFRVLTLQDDVTSELIQLIDGGHGTALSAVSKTLYFTLDRRDAAIDDIVDLAPPPPPPADDAHPSSVDAHASGNGGGGSTFESVMPGVVPQLDDELQSIEEVKSDASDLTAGGRRLLHAAATQITKTRRVVNTTWPPLPADD
jgi:hypothetical protein